MTFQPETSGSLHTKYRRLEKEEVFFFKFEVTVEDTTALDLESDAQTQCKVRMNKWVDQLCSFKTPLFLQILKKTPTLCRILQFILVLTKAHHLSVLGNTG